MSMMKAIMARWSLLTIFAVGGCRLIPRVLAAAPEYVSSKVVIVGAGLAGMTAAKILIEAGVQDVILLEATERIGGRARDQAFGGVKVELGSNWVTGTTNEETKETNPIWILANAVQLQTYYSDFDNMTENTYDENGCISPEVATPVWDESYAAFDFADSLGANYTSDGREDISLLSTYRIGRYMPSTPLEMAVEFFNHDWEFAEPPRVTSVKATHPLPTFELYGDEFQFVADPRGFAAIVQYLGESVLESEPVAGSKTREITDARLKLNKVAQSISYSVNGAEVTTADGSVYAADHVILTVSVGVLQSDLIDFQPDLPAWKIEALFQFNMAIYTKIFLKFPSTFWPTGSSGTEYFVYADAKRGYYPVWQHLDNEYPGSNIVFVTVTDDESRRIEQQSDNATLAEAMEVLRKMFGPDIPDATDILVSRWWSNSYFRGSYSNWPIGVDSKDFDKIQANLGRLYFSGEHTSEKFNGYLQGAYDSGIRSANEVLACINGVKCSKHIARLPLVTPAPGDGGDCEVICTQNVNRAISAQVAFCKQKVGRAVRNATRNCPKA